MGFLAAGLGLLVRAATFLVGFLCLAFSLLYPDLTPLQRLGFGVPGLCLVLEAYR